MGWYPESNASFSIGRLRHLQLSIGKTNIYYVTWIELLISKINKHVITDNYSWYLESKSHTLYKWGKQQNLDGTSWLGGYLESSPFLFCEEEKLTFPKPYHPWDWHISLQVPSKSTNVSKCSVSTTIHSWMVWIISHTWVCPRDDQSTVFPSIGKQERIVRTCYVPLARCWDPPLWEVGHIGISSCHIGIIGLSFKKRGLILFFEGFSDLRSHNSYRSQPNQLTIKWWRFSPSRLPSHPMRFRRTTSALRAFGLGACTRTNLDTATRRLWMPELKARKTTVKWRSKVKSLHFFRGWK